MRVKKAEQLEDKSMADVTDGREENSRLEWHECRVCGVRGQNKTYTVKEMMYGTKDEFDYFVCENCKCMQICEVPENLGEYYQNNYYSMTDREQKEFEGEAVYTDARILDVGCGTGEYLLAMAEQGYGNLYGCDPFIEEDIRYGDRIYIKKCEITELEGEFDCIRFGDSFEHMDNPMETLQAVKRLLKKDGLCQINMPVFPNVAFETFGVNWFEIDAPRHLILHSKQSLKYLCKRTGLKIQKTEFNSDVAQFVFSYYYEMGIPFQVIRQNSRAFAEALGDEMMESFKKATQKANEKEYGDHACFYLVHDSEDER